MTSETTPAGRYGIVFVTASSRAEAEAIAHALIQAKLAACVNLFPVHSIYTWQGSVQQDDEWQLLIKTDLQHFEAIADRIRQLHSYEVPEIVALPLAAGSQAYLQWIAAQVQP